MALTTFRPTRANQFFDDPDPDDPKKRRRGFRPQVTADMPQDATQLSPNPPGRGTTLADRLVGFGRDALTAVNPFQEGFTRRGVPGLIRAGVEDIQRNPVGWSPGPGDALGVKEGFEMMGEHPIIGSIVGDLSVLGLGEIGRPAGRILRSMAENLPETVAPVTAIMGGLRRKPMGGAPIDPAQVGMDLADPRATRVVPEAEQGLMETGDMPGNWISRTARAVERGPEEATASEWQSLLTGDKPTGFVMPERGVRQSGFAQGQNPDVPRRELKTLDTESFLRANEDPTRVISRQEVLQRIDDRTPPYTETVSDDYSEYAMPNGENYKAIAVSIDSDRMAEGLAPRLHRLLQDEENQLVGGGTLRKNGESYEIVGAHGGVIARGPATESGLQEMIDQAGVESLMPPGFSSHFGEPGTFAHLRLQDQVDYDGDNVLAVQEIQSDLHQKGRSGYARALTDEEIEALPRAQQQKDRLGDEADRTRAAYREARRVYDEASWRAARGAPEDIATLKADMERLDAVNQRVERQFEAAKRDLQEVRGAMTGAPRGPFENTDDWTALMVRRAFREAMDGGYKKIAFPTGEQIMAVPNMGASEEVARYYDRTVHQQVKRVSKELGLPEPQIRHGFEGPVDRDVIEGEMNDLAGDLEYRWNDALSEARGSLESDLRDSVDPEDYLDRDDFFYDGEFDQDEWDSRVDDLLENMAEEIRSEWEEVPGYAFYEIAIEGGSVDDVMRRYAPSAYNYSGIIDTSDVDEGMNTLVELYEGSSGGESYPSLFINLPAPGKPGPDKWESAKNEGMRLAGLVGATAVGAGAMQARKEQQ